jgi:hypothetical protein
MVSPPSKQHLTSCGVSSSSLDEEWSPGACLTGTPVRAEGAVGSAGAWCTIRDVKPKPVLTWCRGNRRVGYPSGSMSSSAMAAQSSTTRLLLLRLAAQEGVRSDRISNGNAIPFQEFTLVLLFFTSLLLHHSMDFKLAHARYFGHVGFHLVAITLLSRWRQLLPTRRLQIPFSGILDLGHVLGTRRIIRRPGICHASCRSVDALCLARHIFTAALHLYQNRNWSQNPKCRSDSAGRGILCFLFCVTPAREGCMESLSV